MPSTSGAAAATSSGGGPSGSQQAEQHAHSHSQNAAHNRQAEAPPCLFELQTLDGSVSGPYTAGHVIQLFTQSKLGLESRIRERGQMAFKSLALVYHKLI